MVNSTFPIGRSHACFRFQEGPGPACADYQPDPLSQAERDALLHKHNDLRNKMALGQVPPYPAASDMMEMVGTGLLDAFPYPKF